MKLFFQLVERVFPYFIAIFILFLGLRTLEFLRSPNDFFGEPVKWIYFSKGILFDLLISFILTSLIIILQYPLSYFFKSKKIILFHIISLFILVSDFLLIEFFLAANEPLNESIFLLSKNELLLIGGTGDRITIGLIITLVSIIGLYFFIGRLAQKIPQNLKFKQIFASLLLLSIFLISFSNYKPNEYNAETLFVNNRVASFGNLAIHFLLQNPDKTKKQTENYTEFDKLNPNFYGGEKLSKEFPLLHKLPVKSEFAELFNKRKNDPPNIVFIIVESLSTSLVGEKADKTGHIMPFLDSLTKKSLYFPNFLSTCERTHNVLPAALSSVPNAPDGNMFMQMENPLHWSLMSLLKKEYYSRFYCGADLSYFNMNGFMNSQQTSYLVKNWKKPPQKTISNRENTWGYTDGQLFKKSWTDYKNQSLKNKRRLDVILTISTHDPYVIPNQDEYTKRVVAKIDKIKRPTEIQLDVKKNALKFATYAYLDDELRNYFQTAKQQPDFDNTLFFIFGDHGNELCQFDQLERFKIPLIIYSPLLKKAKTIRSVSTHLDLTPTIINYLRTQYNILLPKTVPFIGKELSLTEKFECKRTLPFNTIGWKNLHVLNKNYFLHNEQLFQVNDGLSITKIDKGKITAKYRHQLKLYNLMSKYVSFRNKIIPKSFFSEFCKIEEFRLVYSYQNINPTKKERSEEYIHIGEGISISKKTKYFKVNFLCGVRLKTIADLQKIPQLTIALKNEINKKTNLILWKQSKPKLIENFKPNKWNKIEYSMVIRMKDYKNVTYQDNDLTFYLLNMSKQEWKIKNFNTHIFTNLINKK